MSNKLAQAISEYEEEYGNLAETANGAVTLASSKDPFVDLFAVIGSSRKAPEVAANLFREAYYDESKLATRIALWARDCRGGAGEREVFRQCMTKMRSGDLITLIQSGKIDEFGRWDDYVGLMADHPNQKVREAAASRVLNALNSGTAAQLILLRVDSMSDEQAAAELATLHRVK